MVRTLLERVGMGQSRIKSWVGIPPWIIIGAVLVLVPIFVFLTLESIHRQKEHTTRLLVEKGAALIRSFEAGARTGMMGMHWGGFQVQRLLMETAQQPDIVYLLVTDHKGRVLAHSDIRKVGSQHGAELDLERISRSQQVRWRLVPEAEGGEIFEVFRQFSPTRGLVLLPRRMMMPKEWWQQHMNPEGIRRGVRQVIFVGLNMGSIEAARQEDVRHTVIMAVILLLIGFAGIVSLFLAQAYRTTRQSLSRVQAFSDNLVRNMPIGLVALDSRGRVASFNQEAAAILDLKPLPGAQPKPEQILPEPLVEIVQALSSRTGPIEKEIRCPLPDGRILPLEIIATSLEDESGSSIGSVILFRDLSEILHLKEEVTRNQRLAAIGRLAAGVAHEIRNPLSSIKGFATYFKERYREVPEDHKTAEIMIQEVERLNRVISQLLDFARPVDLQKRPSCLTDLLHHVHKMIEREAQNRGVHVSLKTADAPKEVLLDPDKIKQVLLNLLFNALESMDGGGRLEVEIPERPSKERVLIRVSDTGVGIREEDLGHIFDPFFTTKPAGTGLGLAIVHKIVEAHGGEIRVESRPDQGTRVTLILPA